MRPICEYSQAQAAALRPLRARAALLGRRGRGHGRRVMAEPVETPRRNLTGAIVPALAVAALAAVGALLLVGRHNDAPAQSAAIPGCILGDNAAAIGGPIDLVDSNGSQVTQADFSGQPAVIYFGFTHCPDVCPTTMYTLTDVLAQPTGYDVQPILITVDPTRDTPEVMRAYTHTSGYPAGLVGLTGSEAQVQAAERAFHVYANRSPIPGAPADTYNVDHSSLLYVVDDQWRTVAAIPTMSRADPNDPRSPMVPTSVQNLSACIAAGLGQADG